MLHMQVTSTPSGLFLVVVNLKLADNVVNSTKAFLQTN